MSGECPVEAEGVIAGFLTELYEPWCSMVYDTEDEWGEYANALWQAAEKGIFVGATEEVLTLINWLREIINYSVSEGWLDVEAMSKAQSQYQRIVGKWLDKTKTLKCQPALDDIISALPDWVRPQSRSEQLRREVCELEAELELARQRLAEASEGDEG